MGVSRLRAEGRESLSNRIRMVNVLSILVAAFGLASLPFDWVTAPRWMVIEDAVAVVLFLAIPLLNRAGHHLASRILFLVFGNAIILVDCLLLGLTYGIHLVFFSLAGFGVMLFELREKPYLAVATLVPVAEYLYVTSASPTVTVYYLYSASANALFIVGSIFFLQRTNERSEAEIKRSRVGLIQKEKMAALGEMSGAMAHEINTPLSALRLNVALSRELLGADLPPPVAAQFEKIDRMVERISRIIGALQTFSRSAERDPETDASVGTIIEDTLDLCRERFRKAGVRLEYAGVPETLGLRCHPVQVSQVLLNLLNNGFHAAAAARLADGRAESWVRIEAEPVGDRVRISVSDSGAGVPESARERIFEPFFTTKDPGQGTGLGLSISKGIVEGHGGRVFLDPEGPSTRFVVELPKGSVRIMAESAGTESRGP